MIKGGSKHYRPPNPSRLLEDRSDPGFEKSTLAAISAIFLITVALFFGLLYLAKNSPATQNNLISSGTSITVISPFPQGSLENMVLQKINYEREIYGMPALTENLKLDTSARRHSEDMASRDFFSHVNPDGLGPNDRAVIAGYPLVRPALGGGFLTGVGENILMWYIPYAIPGVAWYDSNAMAEALIQDWMNSTGHRANILNPNYSEIGIGCTWKHDTIYSTTDFG